MHPTIFLLKRAHMHMIGHPPLAELKLRLLLQGLLQSVESFVDLGLVQSKMGFLCSSHVSGMWVEAQDRAA